MTKIKRTYVQPRMKISAMRGRRILSGSGETTIPAGAKDANEEEILQDVQW